MSKWSSAFFLFLLLFATGIFFFRVFFQGKVPIPSDTIVGLYHPFRDTYSKQYPRGIPFKNFLITDPVRQQYPWRNLSMEALANASLPLWNPYNFSGTPLLANFQSAPFYPLNLLFFLLPFVYAWSLLVLFQPLLASIFLFLYMRRLRIGRIASLLAGITFAFSGFSISWMEWNTVIQVALWLPLILLAKEYLLKKLSWRWIVILIFAESAQVFAGHLQILFYSWLISNIYLFMRIFQIVSTQNNHGNYLTFIVKKYVPFLCFGVIIILLTSIQWFPSLKFIFESARDIDQPVWQQAGWFIPWQHLIQFVSPDFFGNPATLNYWGTWNYAELTGYVGLIALSFSLYALFFRRDRKTFFFGTIFFLSLLFALPSPLAKIPYLLHIPFFSTSQPTRLLFLIDFSLSILAGLGLDYFQRRRKEILAPLLFLCGVIISLWLFTFAGLQKMITIVSVDNLLIAKRNLYLPTSLLLAMFLIIIISIRNKNGRVFQFLLILLLFGNMFDLFRNGWKFLSFSEKQYVFPNTSITIFLQKNIGNYRFMSADTKIIPPNFSVMYHLQDVAGYDPLYLRRYAEYIAAMERNTPNISPPFGFNRIITPQNYNSKLVDLLGVKYVLSLSDIDSQKLKKVYQEGETRVYENENVFPRAFFVKDLIIVNDKLSTVQALFDKNIDLHTSAIMESPNLEMSTQKFDDIGLVSIVSYSPNKLIIKTINKHDGFMIVTDIFYPSWKAYIASSNFSSSYQTVIHRADYIFRGVFVPKGEHMIEFSNVLF